MNAMAENRSSALATVKPKMVAASLRSQAKADPKPLGGDRLLGSAIERALVLANLSKQEVSFRMGYRDQSSISKWISGKESPQFDKLWAIEELRESLIEALAALAGCRVRKTISLRRATR